MHINTTPRYRSNKLLLRPAPKYSSDSPSACSTSYARAWSRVPTARSLMASEHGCSDEDVSVRRTRTPSGARDDRLRCPRGSSRSQLTPPSTWRSNATISDYGSREGDSYRVSDQLRKACSFPAPVPMFAVPLGWWKPSDVSTSAAASTQGPSASGSRGVALCAGQFSLKGSSALILHLNML